MNGLTLCSRLKQAILNEPPLIVSIAWYIQYTASVLLLSISLYRGAMPLGQLQGPDQSSFDASFKKNRLRSEETGPVKRSKG
jgi:hypothetical protein